MNEKIRMRSRRKGCYRTPEQPGENPLRDAQARLDAAARAAYGMADDVDPLAFLLELNLACAGKEKPGKKVTPPGLPLPNNEQNELVTGDCIQASRLCDNNHRRCDEK
jgi:hypothetical protein